MASHNFGSHKDCPFAPTAPVVEAFAASNQVWIPAFAKVFTKMLAHGLERQGKGREGKKQQQGKGKKQRQGKGREGKKQRQGKGREGKKQRQGKGREGKKQRMEKEEKEKKKL